MNDRHYAVVVGIDKYPGFDDLQGPHHDAEAFYDWLVDPDKGAVPTDNVDLLRTVDFHPPGPPSVRQAHPWDQEIRNLLTPYVDQGMSRPWIGDRIYIYLAGHGFSEASAAHSDHAALYAANASAAESPNVVGTLYATWFRINAVFREIVLIMDCCRTADYLHGLDLRALPNAPGRSALLPQVKKFTARAQWGQATRERLIDGSVRGIFTSTLLDALDRARPNRLGNVTGTILKNYIHQNLDTVAAGTPAEDLSIDAEERKNIVFARRRSAPLSAIHIHLDPFDQPVDLLITSGPSDEPERVRATEQDVSVGVTPGFYRVVVAGGQRQSEIFEVGGHDVEITV